MGYFVDCFDWELSIKSKQAAIDCARKMMDQVDANGGGAVYQGGKLVSRSYSWVSTENTNRLLDAGNIEGVFREFGYAMTVDRETGIMSLDYKEREKWGDDETFWNALAGAIDDGSYLNFRGEEGELWQYSFKDGVLYEKRGVVTWEE